MTLKDAHKHQKTCYLFDCGQCQKKNCKKGHDCIRDLMIENQRLIK